MTSLSVNKKAAPALLAALAQSLVFLVVCYSRSSQSFQPVVAPVFRADSSVQKRPFAGFYAKQRRPGVAIGNGMAGSASETDAVSIPFDGSEDRFDRWRFLQEFLEGDHPSSDVVNIVLYRVLDGALKYPRPSGGGDTFGSEGEIEMKAEVKQRLEKILTEYATNGRVNAVATMGNHEEGLEEEEKKALEILEQLEGLLPDPVENEDDNKSLWDTVIELHGRQSVKINESQNPVSMDWKTASTVSRVLLHFDFLTLGIVDAPIIKKE
ncbi:unnamed protein product [Pseudo-nitzschia multistriata]|uniref:Uncharacterized protein n=1 Tax=Pseudo-nitzschia multistriata TaxID=183589 RepID=A0A448ZGA5_9STRA|nr:unnamed protein product [Pseudo-nitzschia multistriata]